LKPLLAKLRADPDVKALKRGAASGDVPATRGAAVRMMSRYDDSAEMVAALAGLDRQVFSPDARIPDLKTFARDMLKARKRALRS
jgi:hypothetical protein